MGTEILRPQDCLIERIRFNPGMCSRRGNYNGYPNNSHHSSNYHNTNRPNNNNNRRPAVRQQREKPDQKRQQRAQSEPSMSRRTPPVSDDAKVTTRRSSCDDLAMEKVTILRRRESLDSKIKTGNGAGVASLKKEGCGLVVTGTVRIGPAPEMVPKIRIVDFMPPVAGKTDIYAGSAFAVSPEPSSLPLPSFQKKKPTSIDDSATRDIKRLLRLEL